MTLADAVTPGSLLLYVVLDLPAFTAPVCHGYVHACVCDLCLKREKRAAGSQAQPWEARRAA